MREQVIVGELWLQGSIRNIQFKFNSIIVPWMTCHIKNKKMLLWDIPLAPFILLAQGCFPKPQGADTTPFPRAHVASSVYTLPLPIVPLMRHVKFAICWVVLNVTAKSPGHVRFGGQGATCSLWVCHEGSQFHSLECMHTDVGFCALVWVSIEGGLFWCSRTLSEDWKSLPSLPVLRERIYICNVNSDPLDIVLLCSARTEQPSIAV